MTRRARFVHWHRQLVERPTATPMMRTRLPRCSERAMVNRRRAELRLRAQRRRGIVRRMKSPDAGARAFEHLKRGRLSEAEAGYRRCSRRPDEPDALHRPSSRTSSAQQLALQLHRARLVAHQHHHDAGIVLHARPIDDASARCCKAPLLGPRQGPTASASARDRGRLDRRPQLPAIRSSQIIRHLNNRTFFGDLEHPTKQRVISKGLGARFRFSLSLVQHRERAAGPRRL